ncbi:hypothetical protein ACFW9I_28035 [[Kitasatospora] papulosa]|uniref:hypothetical protein n=1 Tax=[Kitasatospora] papulosa TaxID=1464011 RepID=UPI0036B6C926
MAYTASWSFKLRSTFQEKWSSLTPHRVSASGEELVLWLQDHYLGQSSDDQVVHKEAPRDKIPDFFFASGLTNLPALYDATVEALKDKGLKLIVGSGLANQLRQQLWNLDAHLGDATNSREGYQFYLEQEGRTVASVALHTQRTPVSSTHETARVGLTSDTSHIEKVRTGIDGVSGTHTLSHSTAVSADFAVHVVPPEVPALRLRGTTGPRYSRTYSDSLTASRTGLWVLAPRYKAYTAGYRVGLTHHAAVTVRGEESEARTGPVTGVMLLRLAEPAAYANGFPVDSTAFVPSAGSLDADGPSVPRELQPPSPLNADVSNLRVLRNSGRRRMDDEPLVEVPYPISAGKGVGLGTPVIEEATIDEIRKAIRNQVSRHRFLHSTPNVFTEHGRMSHGNGIDSRTNNEKLLKRMVSRDGLESHWDDLHMDGLTFTFRLRRGTGGIDFDVDSAKITITAGPSGPASFLQSTDEYAGVNLAMGMDGVQQTHLESKTLGWRAKMEAMVGKLRGGAVGLEIYRTVGLSNGVTFLNNRPELMEYSGQQSEFATPTTFTVRIEFQHRGWMGELKRNARNPAPIELEGKNVQVRTIPLTGGESQLSVSPTPSKILDNAVIFHLDTTGVRAAAARSLVDLAGPSADADLGITSFTSNISLRSHAKELFNKEYTTDQPFAQGFFRNTLGAMSVVGTMDRSKFIGATSDKFTLGIIKLWLSGAQYKNLSSWGVVWNQVELGVGEDPGIGAPEGAGQSQQSDDTSRPAARNGPSLESGATALTRAWQWNVTESHGPTGGTEVIDINSHRAYAYLTDASLTIGSRQEKRARLFPSSHIQSTLPLQRKMIYLLSEPEALKYYADRKLPITDCQLSDALARWKREQLDLDGDVTAGVLIRWKRECPDPPEGTDHLELAELLADRHRRGVTVIENATVRDDFNGLFPAHQVPPRDRAPELWIPPYLTFKGPGGNSLGYCGVSSLTHEDATSTYQIVKRLVDKAAPGLLTAEHDQWAADDPVVGRLQGGVNALQALFAKGRDQAMLEDMLSRNGYSLYLFNPVGWPLADVVKINVAMVLAGQPRYQGHQGHSRGTGLEEYSHDYVATAKGRSKDGSQNLMAGFGSSAPHGGGATTVNASADYHRGTEQAVTTVTEQTLYDWNGRHNADFPFVMKVRVERIKMGGRPLNDALTNQYRNVTGQADPITISQPGTLEIQIPQSIAEAKPFAGPRLLHSPRPLPQLPKDSAVTGVLMDDLLPAGQDLLSKVFERNEGRGDTTRGNASLEVLLSRSQLKSHLAKSTQGKLKLADNLFMPGDSDRSVTLWLHGEFTGLEVIAPLQGTGAGRYNKSQSTTSSFQTSGQKTEGNVSGNAAGGPNSQLPTVGADGSATRAAAGAHRNAETENYRREQHAKEQGGMFQVRLRARHQLITELKYHHMSGKSTRLATYRSVSVTGDVYAEIHSGAVDELMDKFRGNARSSPIPTHDWGVVSDRAGDFDLGLLFDRIGNDAETDPHRAHLALASHIRTALGGPPTKIELTADLRSLKSRSYRCALGWAAKIFESHSGLGKDLLRLEYQRRLSALPSLPADARDPAADVILKMNALVDTLAATDESPRGPLQLPLMLSLYSQDPLHLARDTAMELGAEITLILIDGDGRRQRRWISPQGKVDTFAQASPQTVALSADTAQRAGILSDELRTKSSMFDVTDVELANLYRTSWQQAQTFEQAVSAEIDVRIERLSRLDPVLPDKLIDMRSIEDGLRKHTADLDGERQRTQLELMRGREAADSLRSNLYDLELTRLQEGVEGSHHGAAHPLDRQIHLLTTQLKESEQKLARLGLHEHVLNTASLAAKAELHNLTDRRGQLAALSRSDSDERPVTDSRVAPAAALPPPSRATPLRQPHGIHEGRTDLPPLQGSPERPEESLVRTPRRSQRRRG